MWYDLKKIGNRQEETWKMTTKIDVDPEGREERKKELFRSQKQLLDTFLEHGAISKAQYDKSLGDLIIKMGIREEDIDL